MNKDNDSRRSLVPFDPFYFEHQKKEGAEFSIKETFNKIHNTNHWLARDSVSGAGSEISQVNTLLVKLKTLLKDLGVKNLLDIPCGDFNWMKQLHIPEVNYSGGDIVQSLTMKNKEKYGSLKRRFFTIDITSGKLPGADLLLCRDCLVHFSYKDISRTVINIKKSNIRYLLTTTFPDTRINEDIVTGDWRPINLEAAPFNFPSPIQLINEKCSEAEGRFRDKSLGLWLVEDLP